MSLPTIVEDAPEPINDVNETTSLMQFLEESYTIRVNKYLQELIDLNEELNGVQLIKNIDELKSNIIVGGEFFYIKRSNLNTVNYSGVITYYNHDLIKTETSVFLFSFFKDMFILYRPYTDNKVSMLINKLTQIMSQTEFKLFCNRLQFELTCNVLSDDSDDSDEVSF
jgi:hypothetical protein